MKTKITLLIGLVMMVSQGFSQIYGFKFGWNQPEYNLSSKNFTQDKEQLYQGYQYGAFVRTDSARFYFQIEAFYMKREGTFFNEPTKPNYDTAIRMYNQHVTIQTINIPFSIGFRVIRLNNLHIRAFGGIQSSVTFDKKITSNYTFSPITEDLIENIVVKYYAGVGVDLYFLSCELRYYFENTSAIKPADNITFPYKDKYFNYSVAIKF